MGNYLSCTLYSSPGSTQSTAKVVLPDGDLRQLDGPLNAAELMLDVPGHFVVNSRSMHVGRRFSPLVADEDLEMGNVYVMFPMKKAKSVVAAADMARLLVAANRDVRRASGGRARVLPEAAAAAEAEDEKERSDVVRVKFDEMDPPPEAAAEIGEMKYRLSMSRSRKPTLETIEEEIISYR
ncbi:uncharacterized protein [Typha angustifolia]|uniref:uncharacterized protein n=1 Tax=Typha angustifolia TaxID=59011 RepID=UPI003C2AED8C